MSIGTEVIVQGLQPAFLTSPVPLPESCTLPIGGGVGTGAAFPQGQAIAVISGTPANAVFTQTLSPSGSGGGLSGNIVNTLVFAGGTVQVSYNFDDTPAEVQAAFEAALPGWVGAITVTGLAADHYVVTFGGYLGDTSIGGMWTAAVTGGTAEWALTTPGSSNAQFDAYSEADNDNKVEGFLVYPVTTDYTGAPVGQSPSAGSATGQPGGALFLARGIFYPADLVGLDANAYTITPNLVKKSGGQFVELL